MAAKPQIRQFLPLLYHLLVSSPCFAGAQGLSQAGCPPILPLSIFQEATNKVLLVSKEDRAWWEDMHDFLQTKKMLLEAMEEPLPREPRKKKRFWRKQKSADMYKDMQGSWRKLAKVDPQLEDAEYMENFRVSKRTFSFLLDHLVQGAPEWVESDRPGPNKFVVCKTKRLALTLHWLANAQSFKALGNHWGIGTSTANKVVHQTVAALEKVLRKGAVVWPAGAELDAVMRDFEALAGLSGCAGAIDGCMIPMTRPNRIFGNRWWCYKGFYAMLLLAVVDARGYFTYVRAGEPSSVGDAASFNSSSLSAMFDQGRFLPHEKAVDVQGVKVRPYIVADAAFPFKAHVMKGFQGDPIPGSLKWDYNYAHVRTMRVVENAFGRLKGRFQVMKLGKLKDPRFMMQLVRVCCMLHNVCQRTNDPYEEDWLSREERAQQIPGAEENPWEGRVETAAGIVREALAQYVHIRAQGL
jgi:hypothetical protein